MYKKIVSIVLGLYGISFVAMAEETKNFVTNYPTLSQWDFDAEISNYAGYNIDTYAVGMLGTIKLGIESTLIKKQHTYFSLKDKYSGTIAIEDLEIKIYQEFEQTNTPTYAYPLDISWGDISGTVNLGLVYLKLAYNDHDKIDLVDSLEDNDLDFSVINYSIIPVSTTATFGGATSDTVGDVISFNIDPKRGLIGTNFIEKASGAFAIGVLIDDVLDLRLGFSTANGFYDSIATNYNPMAFSLFVRWSVIPPNDLNIITLKFKSSLTIGNNNTSIAEDGNPIQYGASFQYDIFLFKGQFRLVPTLGFEAQYEILNIINPTSVFQGETAVSSLNDTTNSHVFEIATGIIFDWSSKGRLKVEGDFLNFKTGIKDKVTDGASLSFSVGQVQNEIFRQLKTNYFSVKLALWDSEEKLYRGLLPFIQTAFIININHSFGGRYTGFHKYIAQYQNAPSSEIVVNERTDVGLGLQFKTKLLIFQPYFNGIFKYFDINTTEDFYKVTNFFSLKDPRIYNNRVDMRFKIGTEFGGLIPYVTFDVYWESGDLIKSNIKNDTIDAYSFFSNENATGNVNYVSNAKYGVFAMGVKVKY